MIDTVIDREIDRMPADKRLPFARTLLRAAVLSPGELNVFAVLLATPGRAEVLRRYEDEKVLIGINSRWETVQTNIMEFLDKCKSLNEAVKLFPTITMYLHHDDISRLNRKVERTAQRRAIVAEVDVEGITAAAIAAKLTASL